MTLALRRMRPSEEGRLYEVLRDAVLNGAAAHYDEAQRHAWAPDTPFEGWVERLGTTECFVAVLGARIVGFIAATPAGHVDLAYVLPEYHGKDVARRLLDRVEAEMRLMHVDRLTTGASLVAEPFFARHGWSRDGEETVDRNGQKLRRVRMFKRLSYQDDSHAS